MKKLASLLISLLLINIAVAQVDFLESFANNAVLDSGQLQVYNKISELEQFSTIRLVRAEPLASSINSNGFLQINLETDEYGAEECSMLKFAPKVSRYIDEQNYYYYGSLVEEADSCSCKCQSGEIMIRAADGRKYGYFKADEAHYEILAIDTVYSVIRRIDIDFFEDKEECVALDLSEREDSPSEPDVEFRNGDIPCMIRVLFLYTQALETRLGLNGIRDLVGRGLDQTNQALFNSEVNNVRVDRANLRLWDGFNENPNNLPNDLRELMSSGQVAQWRQADLADVVCLISNTTYNNTLGVAGSIPDPNNPGQFISNEGNPREDLAFMIVTQNSFASNFTFSHELGHVIGCRHQTCATFQTNGCADEGTFEHGYGWGERRCGFLCKWKNYSTIMHQLRDKSKRLLNFSNPNVFHNGYATGFPDINDNARWIRSENGCRVANYFPDPDIPLSVNIMGEPLLCQPLPGNYQVVVAGSGAPYTYDWHISTDGANWTAAGTSQSISLSSNDFQSGTNVFLRVKVTNATGNMEFAFFTVAIISPANQHTSCFQHLTGGPAPDLVTNIKAYPNPFGSTIQISFAVTEDEAITDIRIFTITGMKLASLNKALSRGEYVEEFPIRDFAAGPLLLQVRIGDRVHNQLVIKK